MQQRCGVPGIDCASYNALRALLVFICFEQSDVPTIAAGADGIIAAACYDDADTVVTGAFGLSMFGSCPYQ